MRLTSIRRAAAGLAAALVLSLAPVAVQAAPNDTPATAVVLAGTVAGDLPAAPPNLGAGRQAYLRFEYPGDDSSVTVSVDITPGDLVSASHAGVKVYGPTGGKLYAEGGQTGTHPSHEATFSSTEAGTYLVEVFNYNVTPVHYEATATGLPPQQAAPAAAASGAPTGTGAPAGETSAQPAAPTPVPVGSNGAADRAAELEASATGVLVGTAHYYRFAADDGAAQRLELAVSPASSAGAVELVVSGPTGQEYARAAGTGGSATLAATFAAE